MKGLIVFGLLFAQGVVADEVKEQFCQPVAADALQRMASLPQGRYAAWWPEFFEEKLPNGSKKLYAGLMCSSSVNTVQNGGNCIVDLETGKITQAPGWFDGQWTKDHENESIFTIPNKYPYPKGVAQPGLSFYRYKDVLTHGGNAPLMYRDPAFGNHYHSFGVLDRGVDPDGRKFVIHRAMNDKWGVSIKDYKFILSASGETISVAPVGGERNLTNGPGETEVIKPPSGVADPNPHSSFFDLPMISPDGQFFGINNRRTMTTQIYEITDSGKRLVADLGIETGKISIAPRRSGDMYVAFHIDQLDPAEGDKMTGVHLAMTKDVVVMRLSEQRDANGQIIFEPAQMVRVTNSGTLGSGNYYPKWINANELVFIESTNGNRQTFVKADMRKFNFKNDLMPRPGANISSQKYAATTALGYYVANVCTNFSNRVTAKESALYSMVLTKESCFKLADTWDQWRKLVENSGALYDLRAPKAPGSQRYPGWNFHESSSKRAAERFEKPISRADVSALTAEDLRAVCTTL